MFEIITMLSCFCILSVFTILHVVSSQSSHNTLESFDGNTCCLWLERHIASVFALFFALLKFTKVNNPSITHTHGSESKLLFIFVCLQKPVLYWPRIVKQIVKRCPSFIHRLKMLKNNFTHSLGTPTWDFLRFLAYAGFNVHSFLYFLMLTLKISESLVKMFILQHKTLFFLEMWLWFIMKNTF